MLRQVSKTAIPFDTGVDFEKIRSSRAGPSKNRSWGAFWDLLLAPFWHHFGAFWHPFGALWEALGFIFVSVGRLVAHSGAFGVTFDAPGVTF